ncbi:MAG: hypothetical protein IJ561_00915 [Ruminococcus sp.]|nr:hypothetical protein [Ruminococcus sp.]
MRFKINKPLLSIATAIMMVTSMISMLGTSAAAANEITLSCDKSYATEGQRINVTVGYLPGEVGAAGFTLNLHFDNSKLNVHIPTENETAKYNVGSAFSVITNYDYAPGVVRIVGADLTSSNIASATSLSLASFDVKNGTTGDINFWVEVETMVSASNGSFVNSAFSATALTVKSAEPVTTTTTTPTTTTTTTTTTTVTTPAPETTTTTTPAITTSEAVTTVPPETTTTTTTPVTTTPPETTTTPAPETTAVQTEPAAPVTTEVTTTPTTTTTTTTTTAAPAPVPAETEEPSVEEPAAETPIFAYLQGGTDFNSEEDIHYIIPVSEYVTDRDKHYDVKITVQATGNTNAGIGMMLDGSYTKQNEKLRTKDEEVWTVKDIVPSHLNSDIVVGLYYLKNNSEFTINNIVFEEVTPVNAPAEEIEEQIPEFVEVPSDNDEEIQLPETADTNAVDDEEAEAPAEQADNDTEPAETPVSDIEGANGQAAIGEEQPAVPTPEIDTASPAAPEDVENAVISAAGEAAQQPDSNPVTGSHTGRNIIFLLCGAEILWSLFALIFNKVSDRKGK